VKEYDHVGVRRRAEDNDREKDRKRDNKKENEIK
jgi:hypothetical protein